MKTALKKIKQFKDNLNVKWKFNNVGYWDPLEQNSPLETIFLGENVFMKYEPCILKWIKSRSEDVYFFGEAGEAIVKSDEFNTVLSIETVASNFKADWIIYNSHEYTVTFGGEDLVSEIRKLLKTKTHLINKWP